MIAIQSIKQFFGIEEGQTQLTSMVDVGDKFEQRMQGFPVWIVNRVNNVEGCTFPLVSMYREDKPDLTKTLSMTALNENDEFRPHSLS